MSRTACGSLRKVTKLSQNKAGTGSTNRNNSRNDPLFVRRPAEVNQIVHRRRSFAPRRWSGMVSFLGCLLQRSLLLALLLGFLFSQLRPVAFGALKAIIGFPHDDISCPIRWLRSPKNRPWLRPSLNAAFMGSDPGFGGSLRREAADRRRAGIRDRNLHAEPASIHRNNFVQCLGVGVRSHAIRSS